MLTFTQRLPADSTVTPTLTLELTAEERTRSRIRWQTVEGEEVRLQLPRGTVLRNGDRLQSETGDSCLKIIAKPEPVLTVTAHTHFDLLRAAYHLGNRHVPLEVSPHYLRLSPDAVLKSMLEQLGHYHLVEEVAPFEPETGAYSSHSHSSHSDHAH